MEEGKKKNVFLSDLLSSLMFIVSPFLLTYALYSIMIRFPTQSENIAKITSYIFGFGVSFVFQISCCIVGLFKGKFVVVIKRFIEFKENLIISFKYAFKEYWRNIFTNGITFWVYLAIMTFTLLVCIFKINEYLSLI